MNSKARVLYYSFNGMAEDLGKSQVLEYLLLLADEYEIDLISYEKDINDHEIEKIESYINGKFHWHRLNYSNQHGSVSTVKSLLKGWQLGKKICREKSIDIVHCRSMLPSLIGLQLRKRFNCKLLFDIRGFATEEKVDRGRIKRNGITYNLLMYFENKLYRKSDHIVTLTYKAKEILLEDYKELSNNDITVIPTCASRETFRTITENQKLQLREELGYTEDNIIFVHTGNVGTWYDFDSEVRLIKELSDRNTNIRFLVINKGQHQFIEDACKKYALNEKFIKIISSDFDKVYKYLNISDYSLFFIKPLFSKQASAPTKYAENVSCYLPTISNSNVGDMERYLTNYKTGICFDLEDVKKNTGNVSEIVLNDFENRKAKYNHKNFDQLFSDEFDKKLAVEKYKSIYNLLL